MQTTPNTTYFNLVSGHSRGSDIFAVKFPDQSNSGLLLVSSSTKDTELLMHNHAITHSSTLAWKIPWIEEPSGLQSMGSRRVGHD